MAFAGQRYLKSGLRIVVLVAGCAGLGACAGFGFGENPPPQPQPVYVPPPVVAAGPHPAPAPHAKRAPSLLYNPNEISRPPLISVALLL
ncbi:MAG: hypothetical protein P4L72_15675, partial [Parvibaculum sp.]|nr:hypothetical protein [Parvibaculum sp.]